MISTRGRYALRMMVDLAEHADDGWIALKDISLRQGISKKYLEQIVPVLNREGLLRTTRGFGGGYRLARQPFEYTVGDIVRATEGSLAPVACLDGDVNTCPRASECATLFVWAGLKNAVDGYLDSITLQDIIEHGRINAGDDYSI